MRSLSCWRAWKNCSGLVRSYLYHIRNYWSRKAFSVSSIMIILSSNKMITYRNVLVGTYRNILAVELFIHVAIKLDNQLCCSLAFIYLVLPFCCHISILISVAPTAKVSSSFFFVCVCVAESRRASVDIFLKAAGYLDCAVRHVLPQMSPELRFVNMENLQWKKLSVYFIVHSS